MDHVIILTGPTGSGKSSLLKHLPQHRLLNSDSMQLYSNLPISSAAPLNPPPSSIYSTRDFIADDLLSPTPSNIPLDEPNLPKSFFNYSRSHYLETLLPLLDELPPSSLPIICGGTMSYNQGVLNALLSPKPVTSSKLLASSTSPSCPPPTFEPYFKSLASPLSELQRLAPATAATLHPNDARKIRNALLLLHTAENDDTPATSPAAEPPNVNTARQPPNLLVIYVDVEPAQLLSKCDARIDSMLSAGLLLEVSALYDRFLAEVVPTLPSPPLIDPPTGAPLVPNIGLFQAIGFKEFLPYLFHRYKHPSLPVPPSIVAQCVAKLKSNTFKYTKKQKSFFHNSIGENRAGVDWIRVGARGRGCVGTVVETWAAGGDFAQAIADADDVTTVVWAAKEVVSNTPRECELCEKVCRGEKEWEAHCKSKIHRVRSSKKWRDAQENKAKYLKPST